MTAAPTHSSTSPRYWQLLLDPEVKTVFITGCGGGFDFVQSVALIPELLKAGKKVVIGSFSFGNPSWIKGADIVWRHTTPPICEKADPETHIVVRVGSECEPDRRYGPEVGLCRYLDKAFPGKGPGPDGAWTLYAMYARAFTPTMLANLHARICNEHAVDAVVAIDGGNDSLMACDEAGVGDPIEDTVSVMTLAAGIQAVPEGAEDTARVEGLTAECAKDAGVDAAPVYLRRRLLARLLICAGLGCDRFQGCSDASTLRAISELTAMRCGPMGSASVTNGVDESGFLGCMAIEPNSEGAVRYRECVDVLQELASFRSIIANAVYATTLGGCYGDKQVPPSLKRRVVPGQLYLWPLMAMHWAFALPCVMIRNKLADHLAPCKSEADMLGACHAMRNAVKVRKYEVLPGQIGADDSD